MQSENLKNELNKLKKMIIVILKKKFDGKSQYKVLHKSMNMRYLIKKASLAFPLKHHRS